MRLRTEAQRTGELLGILERLQHPFTRELEGEGAVDDWVWEIQSRDAEGRDHGRQSRWAGDDLEFEELQEGMRLHILLVRRNPDDLLLAQPGASGAH